VQRRGAERTRARAGSWAGFRQWAENEAAARYGKKMIFQIPFSINFQRSVFKYHFEHKNDFF
jgi:hypothetical protein